MKKYSNFIECLWIGETRIYQKYGKLRNAIIWLPGGVGPEILRIFLKHLEVCVYKISNHSEIVMFLTR